MNDSKPKNPRIFDAIGGLNLREITLRDLFAAFSLAGLRAEPADPDDELTAELAYRDADAMLAERSK